LGSLSSNCLKIISRVGVALKFSFQVKVVLILVPVCKRQRYYTYSYTDGIQTRFHSQTNRSPASARLSKHDTTPFIMYSCNMVVFPKVCNMAGHHLPIAKFCPCDISGENVIF
jgi:hypothetical protein